MQELDCDFLAFSAHKLYGPTGVGVLYGKEALLEQLPPYQGGGEMIARVTFEHTTFERLPFKFEAGTPDYVGTHGLAAAIDYVEAVGLDRIAAHEEVLTRHAMARMAEIDQMQFYGTVPGKTSDRFVQCGADPSDGLGHLARPPRFCDPHRPPLRTTAHGALWSGGHGARFVCALQHRGRNRSFHGGAAARGAHVLNARVGSLSGEYTPYI